MRGGVRGELRIVIGLDGRNKPFPMGAYSGVPWERIGPEIKARLKDRDQATLFVHDGEIGIDEHLSGIAEKTGRSGRFNARRWSGANAPGPLAHAAGREVRAMGRRRREG